MVKDVKQEGIPVMNKAMLEINVMDDMKNNKFRPQNNMFNSK